jgi:hypothetical protein
MRQEAARMGWVRKLGRALVAVPYLVGAGLVQRLLDWLRPPNRRGLP